MSGFFNWRAEGVEEMLKGLILDGLSGSEIAAKIGATRNAVIGKIHRTPVLREAMARREGHRPYAIKVNRPRKPRVLEISALEIAATVAAGRESNMQKMHIAPVDVAVSPFPPKEILDLRDGDCRYPLWRISPEDRERFYCAAPVVEGCSWCATHRKVVFDAKVAA